VQEVNDEIQEPTAHLFYGQRAGPYEAVGRSASSCRLILPPPPYFLPVPPYLLLKDNYTLN